MISTWLVFVNNQYQSVFQFLNFLGDSAASNNVITGLVSLGLHTNFLPKWVVGVVGATVLTEEALSGLAQSEDKRR